MLGEKWLDSSKIIKLLGADLWFFSKIIEFVGLEGRVVWGEFRISECVNSEWGEVVGEIGVGESASKWISE